MPQIKNIEIVKNDTDVSNNQCSTCCTFRGEGVAYHFSIWRNNQTVDFYLCRECLCDLYMKTARQIGLI